MCISHAIDFMTQLDPPPLSIFLEKSFRREICYARCEIRGSDDITIRTPNIDWQILIESVQSLLKIFKFSNNSEKPKIVMYPHFRII